MREVGLLVKVGVRGGFDVGADIVRVFCSCNFSFLFGPIVQLCRGCF